MTRDEEQKKINDIMAAITNFVDQGEAIHYSVRLVKELISRINQLRAGLIREAVERHIKYGDIDKLTIKGL